MSNLPATFEQRVKERISETIADLIPVDELSTLVALQVDHFKRTQLPDLIKKEITNHLNAAVKAELSKPEYQTIWNQQGQQGASEAVKKVIIENAGAILQSLIGQMCQMTVHNLHGNLPRMF